LLLCLYGSQLVLQYFARVAKPIVLFFEVLHAGAQLFIPSPSFRQLVGLSRNSCLELLVLVRKVLERLFQL
jgi:hypothetical protein